MPFFKYESIVHFIFKRIWEAYSLFLVVGLVLMSIMVIGLWGHMHHIYHWADAEAVATDRILQHKSSFLNPVFYTVGTLGFLGIWSFFAFKIRSLSLAEDNNGGLNDFSWHNSIRKWAAAFLPIAAFSSAAMIWQWIMSIDAHWYSTMFAWYTSASWFVAAICLTILTIIYLKTRGYLDQVTDEHIHDLGKFLFAFSIFWTYLWFSQYMLIWYANVGEETIYFKERVDNYPVLFYGNLLINFVLPFFVLMRNSTKRKYGSIAFVSIVVFFGHWWDFFNMIKPGALHTALEAASHADGMHGMADAAHGGEHGAEMAHAAFTAGFTIPGLLELGTFLGFFGLFFYVVFHHLSKASLEAKNDPYLVESVHHHV
ncbi:MAG: hypothetical protein AAFO94_17140 [Bacteroidota bacterium]